MQVSSEALEQHTCAPVLASPRTSWARDCTVPALSSMRLTSTFFGRLLYLWHNCCIKNNCWVWLGKSLGCEHLWLTYLKEISFLLTNTKIPSFFTSLQFCWRRHKGEMFLRGSWLEAPSLFRESRRKGHRVWQGVAVAVSTLGQGHSNTQPSRQ